jgi:hypothetical protein
MNEAFKRCLLTIVLLAGLSTAMAGTSTAATAHHSRGNAVSKVTPRDAACPDVL